MSLVLLDLERGVVLPLDAATTEVVPEAFALFRKYIALRGGTSPPGLTAAHEFAVKAGGGDRRGQAATSADKKRTVAAGDVEMARDERELLTLKAAGEVLGVNARTVRRWIDRGVIRPTPVNGRDRVARLELDLLLSRKDTH